MIPSFVIALREGVEASLIVGIIAVFLVKEAIWSISRPTSEGAEAAFEAIEALLSKQGPELTKADTRKLAQEIDALAEELSQVPAQIVG
jgi:high-affinity Fe2+/Pb2+ permease